MTIDLRAVRSILFLPASNPRAIARAREAGADLVVLDLEDAVKPEDKLAARRAAVDAVERHPDAQQKILRRAELDDLKPGRCRSRSASTASSAAGTTTI